MIGRYKKLCYLLPRASRPKAASANVMARAEKFIDDEKSTAISRLVEVMQEELWKGSVRRSQAVRVLLEIDCLIVQP